MQSIEQGTLLKMVRDGDAIVITREVAEVIIEQLERPVSRGTKG